MFLYVVISFCILLFFPNQYYVFKSFHIYILLFLKAAHHPRHPMGLFSLQD